MLQEPWVCVPVFYPSVLGSIPCSLSALSYISGDLNFQAAFPRLSRIFTDLEQSEATKVEWQVRKLEGPTNCPLALVRQHL